MIGVKTNIIIPDKTVRAKRRRPNLGAPVNGNTSNVKTFGGKDNYFNGPPLRSLAFSPVIKDNGAAQVPLKSARIQNVDESKLNQHKESSFSTATSNANNIEMIMQSKIPGAHVDTNPSSITKSEKIFAKSSHNLLSNSHSNKYRQDQSRSTVNNIADSKVVMPNTMGTTSLPAKQGGKIKTKIAGGLEQARVQRGCTSIKDEEHTDSTKDGHRLQDAKSLSMFMNPGSKPSDKNNMSFPTINFSSASPVKPSLRADHLGTSISPAPLVSKASREVIDKNQDILTRKAGAYDHLNPTSSHISTNTGTLDIGHWI